MLNSISVIKTLAVTAVLIFLMQYQVNGRTLENHALSWLRYSPTANYLRNVAKGGVKATQDLSQQMSGEARDFLKKVSAEQKAQR